MITQQPISAKIAKDLYEELELESRLGTGKKNWIINRALKLYFDYMDTARRARASGTHVLVDSNVYDYIKRWFLTPDCNRSGDK